MYIINIIYLESGYPTKTCATPPFNVGETRYGVSPKLESRHQLSNSFFFGRISCPIRIIIILNSFKIQQIIFELIYFIGMWLDPYKSIFLLFFWVDSKSKVTATQGIGYHEKSHDLISWAYYLSIAVTRWVEVEGFRCWALFTTCLYVL